MTAPADPVVARPRRRWWGLRRAAEVASPTTKVCPACKVVGPVGLLPGQLCAVCQAQQAWTELGADRLVIGRDSIDEALQRRRGEAAGEPWWRRMLGCVPPVVTLGAGALAAWLAVDLLSARPIGPLTSLLDDMAGANRRTTLVGLATLIVAAVALLRLRRQRHYRRLWLVAVHALAVVIGATALVIGGTHWLARGGFGGEYTSMPAREAAVVHSPVERILDATVVVLAPDADGDARHLAMGTGAVVARDEKRAWIVTCSHVAMPYAAVGVWRHARDARPVWVQLSDHREGQAIVRWTAPPPLDVALLELPIEHAPEPVPIAPDASELASASRVTFVPNPYRAGWKVLHGELLRRERHRTPAGAYDLLFTDLPVTHGDSGSGLYDSRGQLVGLNTWTRVGAGPSEGISLPSETMRSLVDAIQAGTIDKLDETVPAPPRE